MHDVLVGTRSKQARRTGMAGPLGEMFDHGEARIPTRVPLDVQFSREKFFSDDLMSIIHCRVRRDEHNGEYWFCDKSASRPPGLDPRLSHRGKGTDFVWPCGCPV